MLRSFRLLGAAWLLSASLDVRARADFADIDAEPRHNLEDMRIRQTPNGKAPKYQELLSAAKAIHDDFIVALRRQLHRRPELMYREETTSEVIQSTLESLGVPYKAGWAFNTRQDKGVPGPGGYGVVAELGTGHPPCVALRSDIDALPIRELTEVPFKSTVEGQMHACGHDGHTSMLLGAAAILKANEALLNGTVRLIFQPAEEGGAGAKRMREEGVLTRYPPAQHAFGFHLWPYLPSGVVGGKPGTMLSASDSFTIEISGVGGHAAMPHLTVDPVFAGAQIITSLQGIVSRETSPMSSAVVSVTMFQAGSAKNIIPKGAMLGGTIRSSTTPELNRVRDRVIQTVHGVAAAHGCNATLTFSPDNYPPTVNDPELYEWVKEIAAPASSVGQVQEIEQSMAGEDFAFFGEVIPSVFLALGQGSGQYPDTNYGLHNPRFAIDESVLDTGAALHAHLAFQTLNKLAAEA
uniref:Peptidase M20 dimerisation domain-containing protein n=1 Tax=Pinguiococcus pyrenoidosus TaxID=172671 RepID=A0A7R9YB95_9STRA